ncbi:Rsp5p-dependent ubiquitination, sorting of cargo proteins at the multivesicular body, partial [Perkinsus chesapeaki]
FSWGLHGDDGNLFHGSGLHHSTAAFSRSFGPGDTIGCGINYDKNTIFYTLNGEYIGDAYSFHGQPFRRRLLPMIGLGTEWTVKINLGQDQFLYRELPSPLSVTLKDLADYSISNGWVRTVKTGRDGAMRIRGSIVRRLMMATNESDRAIASTLQPAVTQFSSDEEGGDDRAEQLSDEDVLLFGDDVTSADPEDDSDYFGDEWMNDVGVGELPFDIEEEMHDDGRYFEVIPAFDDDFDLIPGQVDMVEVDGYDLIPSDGLDVDEYDFISSDGLDVEEYDFISSDGLVDMDELGGVISESPFADVSEPEPIIVSSGDSDDFDDMPVYFEITSD